MQEIVGYGAKQKYHRNRYSLSVDMMVVCGLSQDECSRYMGYLTRNLLAATLELCDPQKRRARSGTVTVLLNEDQCINIQGSQEALIWLQSEVKNTQNLIQARRPRNGSFLFTPADRIFSRISALTSVIEHTSKVRCLLFTDF